MSDRTDESRKMTDQTENIGRKPGAEESAPVEHTEPGGATEQAAAPAVRMTTFVCSECEPGCRLIADADGAPPHRCPYVAEFMPAWREAEKPDLALRIIARCCVPDEDCRLCADGGPKDCVTCWERFLDKEDKAEEAEA